MRILQVAVWCVWIYVTYAMSILEAPRCDIIITKDGHVIERNGIAIGFGGDLNTINCNAQCTGPGASPPLRWYKGRHLIKSHRQRVYAVKTTFNRNIVLNIRNMLESDIGTYTCRGWMNKIGWVEKSISLNYGCRDPIFMCDENRCLDPQYMCDGVKQCRDGFDEDFCDDNCLDDQFACDSGSCLPNNMTCDGFVDCVDGTDEDDCECQDFECKDGMCISLDLVCDGKSDCVGRDDELGCPCLKSEFTCGNGQCLANQKRCDGVTQCTNGADESECSCLETEFNCGNGQCITTQYRCDGITQCSNGADELECRKPCLGAEFDCGDGQCLEKYKMCDGIKHCDNGSDEVRCPCTDKWEFRCSDGVCITATWKCDGYDDCSDGSDENDCDDYNYEYYYDVEVVGNTTQQYDNYYQSVGMSQIRTTTGTD